MTSVVRLRSTCPCGCSHPPGTPCPPPSCDPCGPAILRMPMGVTDGSNALPGQVGEYFTASATFTFSATPVSMQIGLGTLPPGDWDAWIDGEINPGADTTLTEIYFYLPTLPPGFQNSMGQGFSATGSQINFFPAGAPARCNTTVPTAIVLQVSTTGTGTGTGTITMAFNARRMR